jgi:small subunit ribosomal protein S8
MSIDRVSNMLSAIKNAAMVNKTVVELPYSNECKSVAESLVKIGYLSDVKVFKDKFKMLALHLKYDDEGNSVINKLNRVSKPGRRIYKGYKDLNTVAGGYGDYVVSTSRGIMPAKEAKYKKLGGEIICIVR